MDFQLLTNKKKPEGKETIKNPLNRIPIDLKVLTENNNDNLESFINEINNSLFSLRSDYFVKKRLILQLENLQNFQKNYIG